MCENPYVGGLLQNPQHNLRSESVAGKGQTQISQCNWTNEQIQRLVINEKTQQ